MLLKDRSFQNLVISIEAYMKQMVTSGLCYIEDLVFLEIKQFDFEILLMSYQPIVQWNYIIYFHIRSSFLTTFSTSFWKKVDNSKEIVNIRSLLVLIIYYLFISTFLFLLVLYRVPWRYKRDHLHVSIDILLYIMFCIINMMKKHQTQKRSRFEPDTSSPLFAATPLIFKLRFRTRFLPNNVYKRRFWIFFILFRS